MNPDFIRIAHRRAVWAEIQRLLLERYVTGEAPAQEQVICEEVPFSQKEVTQEALMEVLEKIELIQQDESYEMAQFEMRRRDAHRFKPTEEARIPKRTTKIGVTRKAGRSGESSEQAPPRESVEAGEPAVVSK